MTKEEQWKVLRAPIWKQLSNIRTNATKSQKMSDHWPLMRPLFKRVRLIGIKKLLALRQARQSGVDPVLWKLSNG